MKLVGKETAIDGNKLIIMIRPFREYPSPLFRFYLINFNEIELLTNFECIRHVQGKNPFGREQYGRCDELVQSRK